MKMEDFGASFLWGVASSAAQIEGASFEDGRTASIWDVFAEKKGKIKDQSTPQVACDFYHRYEEDILLCKSLGFKVFRFSVSWSRIYPSLHGKPNPDGIAFYHQVIAACLAQELIPMLTLYHWDLPQYLQDSGGWAGYQVNPAFRKLVKTCVHEFGKQVKYWLVMNEPFGFTSLGYALGIHAPGQRSLKAFFQSVHHVALATAEGAKIIREGVVDAQIGTTFSCSKVLPHQQTELDIKAAERIDALVNRLFLEPVLGLDFPSVEGWDLLDKFKIQHSTWRFKDKYRFDFDFIGLQNYFPIVVKHQPLMPWIQAWEVKASERNVPQTDMGWEVNPDAFYDIIKQFAAYPQIKNIFITEGGAYFKDEWNDGNIDDNKRIAYFESHLKALLRAKNEGVSIMGYLVWTLVDNFEWAEGFNARFGLVYHDLSTQKRTVKASGNWWKAFLKSTD